MEELGLDTENMVESTAKLRSEILALTNVDIMEADGQTFKSTYQIMDELAQKWKDLSDIQQATVTELIAGKRQGNIVSSLMQNFNTAREALDTSLNSSGSAMREHAKWSESLEARLNKLKSAWQSLSQTFMSSDFLKGGLDLVIGFVNALDKLIDTIGILGVSIAGMGIKKIFSTTKGLGGLKSIADILPMLSEAFPSVAKGVGVFTTALKGGTTVIGIIKAALSGLWATIAANPILAVVAVAGLAVAGIAKLAKQADELAEKVEEVTSKFKEQHTELVKNKSSFESQAKRYGQLAKGIGDAGENISLTAEEYAEYQSIVNSIADQVPSLVKGYDAQGNAILDYKGNVEQLTTAYEELIKTQNESILKDNYDDIVKDFRNKMKDFDGESSGLKNEVSADNISKLENALNGKYSKDKIKEIFGDAASVNDIVGALQEEGLAQDVHWYSGYDTYWDAIADAIENDPDKVREIINNFKSDFDATAEQMRTAAQAALSKAFDFSDSEYKDINDKTQNLIRQIVGNFDAEQFKSIVDSGQTVEEYVNNMIDSFKNMSKGEASTLEAAFNLQTKFNGGDISYGEYVKGVNDVENVLDGLVDNKKLDANIVNQIKLTLNSEDILADYNALLNDLTSDEYGVKLNTDDAEAFLKDLHVDEIKASLELVESDNADFKTALQDYKDIFDEAKEAGVDFSKTVFGNIDTNARQTLEWTSENLAKYKDELMSWEPENASWDKVRKEYEDSISTVMGTVSTYTIDGKEVDIAFSPMLQTDKGAEVLSSGTVDAYINELISKATEDGKWDKKELIALDAKGLEVDGQKIKGILADIGETAIATSEQMHFVGKDGALALAEAEINAIVEKQAKINEAMAFTTDIEIDTTALETLNTALTESASAMGLTEESIDSLKAKYSKLEGFDAATLFEATANGVKVNREELAKLEKEYNDLTKSKVKEHIDSLAEAYNDTTAEIDKCTNASERAQLLSKREGYMSQIEELAEYQAQLEGVTGAYQRWIDAQNTPEDYEGYQSVATSREDIKDEINRGFISNATKEYIDLLSGEDLVGGTIDDYAEAWDRLDKKVGSTSYSIHDFFTVNDDGDITATGIDRFFEGVKKDFKGSVANFNEETGKWTYDFSQENLQKIQDEWGIGIEAIGLLIEAAASAGYDVDWDNILEGIDLDTSNFETLVSYAESAQSELNKLKGYENLSFNFTTTNIKDATTEIEKAQSAYNKLIDPDNDGNVNLKAEGAEQMRVILSTLLVQKQQLEDSNIAINIDTSGLDESQQDIANAIDAVKTFREKYKNLEIAVTTGQGIDTAKSELSKAMGELQTLGGEGVDIAAQLILGEGTDGETLKTKVDAAITAVGDKNIKVGCKLDETAIGTLNSQLLTNFNPEATVKITGIDDALVNQYTSTEKTAEGTVKWKNDESLVVEYQEKTKKAVGIVDWANNTENVKKSFSANGTVKWTSGNKVKVDVISEVNGTANLNGTANSGRAFRQGDWGIKGSGTALVGELGMETLVRGGKFYTIGDTGAEFIQYRPNDIIFNHKQTEELFRYGRVLSNGGRGRVYADGSAFANGSYPLSGRAFPEYGADVTESDFLAKRKKKKTTTTKTTTTTTTTTTTKPSTSKNSVTGKTYNKNSSSQSKDTKDTAEEFEEIFDLVEIAIARIEREIDNLDQKVNQTYKSWSSRNTALTIEISKVGEEIALQQKAYDKYMAAADAVGLSSSWEKKIRNGEIDIETIKDEALAEKIKDYQTWYEKALDSQDAILDLKDAEAELYRQRFDNIQSQYDGILQGYEHTEAMLNEYISQAEAQGRIVSKKYYDTLIKNEKQRINSLKQEQAALIEARNKAEANGIDKKTQDWYDMCAEIDAVTQAIEEGTTSLIEYNNALRDINFEKFDLVQERISDITSEADFLIELMSNDKLFDDKGKLTGQGAATLGLHGLNHNTYMYQADDYGSKVAEIDNKIASGELDGTNNDVIEKRREYVELQRECILNAEQEKQAVKDLVEDGINLELDALQERIDLHNEELDSMKDLYDYERKVSEQVQNISSLRKQLSAYEGFDDEETRAKVQELKVSLEEAEAELEETEWDRYITQQGQILDTLYDEYELVLNQRLDNVDNLLTQVINGVNTASTLSVGKSDEILTALGSEGTLAGALGTEGAIAQAIVNAVGENGSIKTILNTEANSVGTTLSTAMNNIWSVGEGNAKSILTTYGEDYKTKSSTTNDVLNKIKLSVDSMVASSNKEAEKKVEANKTSTAAKKDPTKDTTKKPSTTTTKKTTTTTTNKTQAKDEKDYYGVALAIWNGNYGWGTGTTRNKRLKAKGFDASKMQKIVNELGKDGYVPSGAWQGKYYGIKTLTPYHYNKFEKGAKNIDKDQLAWTQENGGLEYIIRPSDGAILTPIAKNDSVLNANASGNIWNMANNPAEFIKDNLRLDASSVPNGTNVQSSYVQHFENVNFNMPNVKNYEELLSEFKDDPKFNKLILAMTLDQVVGKSKLAKGKSIR